ncbi:MAG: nuclear transport factor 2 family protein [Caulobacteraceae bacterium]|nr:nuclear transport factor 2 family protein [Caulobacteraceae bacterium]
MFTENAVYDLRPMEGPSTTAANRSCTFWADPATNHPIAHHVTNVVVTQDDDGTVWGISKVISHRVGGGGSAVYRSVVRRTPAGWRMAGRVAPIARAWTMFRPRAEPRQPRLASGQ